MKRPADEYALTACLTAWGTNLGLGKMREISDLTYQTLVTTSDNFLRLETLRDANDRIRNATVQLSTITARYSPQYFAYYSSLCTPYI